MNPYLFALYAWRETTTMHVTLKKVVMDSSKEEVVSLKGKLSIYYFHGRAPQVLNKPRRGLERKIYMSSGTDFLQNLRLTSATRESEGFPSIKLLPKSLSKQHSSSDTNRYRNNCITNQWKNSFAVPQKYIV